VTIRSYRRSGWDKAKTTPGHGPLAGSSGDVAGSSEGAVDVPTGDIPPVPDPDDLATVRGFNFALKIACD
jgi:hypothetical protein